MKLSYEEVLKLALMIVVEKIDPDEIDVIYNRINEDTTFTDRYKTIMDGLEQDRSISIGENETPFDRELCKQIYRKIKEVRYTRKTGIIREDDIDKIIDHCIKQKNGGNTNG